MVFLAMVGISAIITEMGPCDGEPVIVEVQPLVRLARSPETREDAINGLLAIAEDECLPVEARVRAIHAIGSLGAAGAKDRLRILTESPKSGRLPEPDIVETACVAYWRIIIAGIESGEERKSVLLSLLRGENSEPGCRWLDDMARSELAEGGHIELLPELLQQIEKDRGDDSYARDLKWLTEKKITLVRAHSKSIDAYEAALETEDLTQSGLLGDWALSKLEDLATSEVFDVMINHARHLQESNYDEYERRVESGDDHALMRYRRIIGILRENGWTTAQLEAEGLFPSKYFLTGDGPA